MELQDYLDYVKTGKKIIANSPQHLLMHELLNEAVRKADLSEVDITLFDDIFPKGMSTSYLSVTDDMAFYLINKNNILAKVNGGKLNG